VAGRAEVLRVPSMSCEFMPDQGPASTRIRHICGMNKKKPEEQRYLSWKENF
jgi:hypothetical protein